VTHGPHAPGTCDACDARSRRTFAVGDRVKVRDDAKAYGPGSFVPSTHAGDVGTVLALDARGWAVLVAMNDEDSWGCGFRVEELEAV
jgi:hypothetical protein